MGLSMNSMRVARDAWGRRVTAPGCDDAPVVDVEIGEDRKIVTLILPYYNNPETLRKRVKSHLALANATARMIVVDDGSPMPAEDALKDLRNVPNFRLYRIGVDVRWNWLAARNIGAHEADDGWLILTDMDHRVPFTTAAACVYGKFDEGTVYRFLRRSGGSEISPHHNSWFMTKATYWKIGGYDEKMSGHYGTDGHYRRRVARIAPILTMNRHLIRREHEGDASTVDYRRKEAQDAQAAAMLAEYAQTPPKVLSFPYERVL